VSDALGACFFLLRTGTESPVSEDVDADARAAAFLFWYRRRDPIARNRWIDLAF